MKRFFMLFFFSALFLGPYVVSSQIVDGISYQAVAYSKGREIAGMDLNGNILTESLINIRFTILSNDPNGDIVYQEVHQTFTDSYGMFSLVIGHGNQTSASAFSNLTEIPWGDFVYFLKVEIAFSSTYEYEVSGIQQLMSVPFSFYALKAKSIEENSISAFTNDAGYLTDFIEQDGDPSNELQTLSISNDTLYLTNGGFVKLPEGFSGNYNDLSNLPDFSNWDTDAADDFSGQYNDLTGVPTNISTFNNDVGYITSFLEQDGDPTNELQILSISNDTLYLTNGGFVKLPEGFSGNYNDLSNLPDFSNWDTDAADDFSGHYSDLTGAPTNISSFNNDVGYLIEYIELDGDPTNELQTLSISNDTIYLTNGGYVKLPEGFNGEFSDLSNIPSTLTGYGILDAASINHSHDLASHSQSGFMSSSDKLKLDSLSLQTLSFDGQLLTISSGNSVSLPISTSTGGVQVFSTAGSYTFTVPANVTNITVEVWGGGGGGSAGSQGESSTNKNWGAGGGSGSYGKNFFQVEAGQEYTVTIGTGGSGGLSPNGSGANGGSTSFGTLLTAGGGFGASGTTGGNGGTCTALFYENGIKGGNGASGCASCSAGAGGAHVGPNCNYGKGGNGSFTSTAQSGQGGLLVVYW